jgi:hypothetical protein
MAAALGEMSGLVGTVAGSYEKYAQAQLSYESLVKLLLLEMTVNLQVLHQLLSQNRDIIAAKELPMVASALCVERCSRQKKRRGSGSAGGTHDGHEYPLPAPWSNTTSITGRRPRKKIVRKRTKQGAMGGSSCTAS